MVQVLILVILSLCCGCYQHDSRRSHDGKGRHEKGSHQQGKRARRDGKKRNRAPYDTKQEKGSGEDEKVKVQPA